MDIIRLIGDDLELDGAKVAKILDIGASERSRLEKYISYANDYENLQKSIAEDLDKLKDDLLHQEEIASRAYNEGKTDGYAEGKNDGASN